MSVDSLHCANCKAPLPIRAFNVPGLSDCPSCNMSVKADVFPALFRRTEASRPGEDILLQTEAGCFFHPAKKAVVACGSCGRFLCALCDIEFSGSHICASCLEAGKRKRRIRNLETGRVLYDDIALSLAIVPLLTIIFFWLTVITAPASLFIAIRHWKSPSSIIARTKARLIFAIFLSGLQTAGWLFLLVRMLSKKI